MSKVWSKIQDYLQSHQEYTFGLFAALMAFVAPLNTSLLCVLFLTIVDNAGAVFIAIKRGGTVESSKFRKTIAKLAIYFTAIISGYVAETAVVGREQAIGIISKTLIFCCVTAELKSILEKITAWAAINGQNLNFWSVLLSVLQQKGGNQFPTSVLPKDPQPPQNPPTPPPA